jgi:DUF1680 family protein
LFLRIPGWAKQAEIRINGKPSRINAVPGNYAKLTRSWIKGDVVELILPMKPVLVEANPLVEESRGQVAIKRGPMVYCLESPDLPIGTGIFDIKIPSGINMKPVKAHISGSEIIQLEGEFYREKPQNWDFSLYRTLQEAKPEKIRLKLIPYYVWDNRGESEMTVWMPLAR